MESFKQRSSNGFNPSYYCYHHTDDFSDVYVNVEYKMGLKFTYENKRNNLF